MSLGLREFTPAECHAVLEEARFGHLACCKDGQPYVVPIYFSYKDGVAYCFSMPGRKVEWMRENDRVCLQVDRRVGKGWTSVIAEGKFEEFPTLNSGGASVCTPGKYCRSTRTGGSRFAQPEGGSDPCRISAHLLRHPCPDIIGPRGFRHRLIPIARARAATGQQCTTGYEAPGRLSARPVQWAMKMGIVLSSIMPRVTPPKIVCCQRGWL